MIYLACWTGGVIVGFFIAALLRMAD